MGCGASKKGEGGSGKTANLVVVGVSSAGKKTVVGHLQSADGKFSSFGWEGVLHCGNCEAHFGDAHGAIFVLDSSEDKLTQAAEKFKKISTDSNLSDKPILICANKQDLPNATAVSDVETNLGTTSLQGPVKIVTCTATTSGVEILAGFEWLLENIGKIFTKLEDRIAVAAAAQNKVAELPSSRVASVTEKDSQDNRPATATIIETPPIKAKEGNSDNPFDLPSNPNPDREHSDKGPRRGKKKKKKKIKRANSFDGKNDPFAKKPLLGAPLTPLKPLGKPSLDDLLKAATPEANKGGKGFDASDSALPGQMGATPRVSTPPLKKKKLPPLRRPSF